MEVTVLEVVDPAEPESEFLEPGEGNRFVAVRVRVANVGSAVYNDTLSNGATIIDGDNQGYDATFMDTAEGPSIGSPRIAPGDQQVGFLTFELSGDARLRTLQITLESGFGPETGEWTL